MTEGKNTYWNRLKASMVASWKAFISILEGKIITTQMGSRFFVRIYSDLSEFLPRFIKILSEINGLKSIGLNLLS